MLWRRPFQIGDRRQLILREEGLSCSRYLAVWTLWERVFPRRPKFLQVVVGARCPPSRSPSSSANRRIGLFEEFWPKRHPKLGGQKESPRVVMIIVAAEEPLRRLRDACPALKDLFLVSGTGNLDTGGARRPAEG